MPTAGKVTAAIIFGAIAFIISQMIPPLLPEGKSLGYLVEINVALGIVCGWFIVGPRAEHGLNAALSGGLTAAVALLFWGLVFHSLIQMVAYSLRKRYDGPTEALTNMVELGVGFGRTIATVEIMGLLFIGGAVGGLFCGVIARRWS